MEGKNPYVGKKTNCWQGSCRLCSEAAQKVGLLTLVWGVTPKRGGRKPSLPLPLSLFHTLSIFSCCVLTSAQLPAAFVGLAQVRFKVAESEFAIVTLSPSHWFWLVPLPRCSGALQSRLQRVLSGSNVLDAAKCVTRATNAFAVCLNVT